MTVDVINCKNRSQYRDFMRLPFLLHQEDSNWVPPLHLSVKRILSKKNPFFGQAYIQFWVAYMDQKPVGRIAGIINHAHNQYYQEKVAFWGFFETIDSIEVSQALFSVLEEWAYSQDMKDLRGPVNPSINYETGLQISAFETKPFIMMPQNPDFYPNLVEKNGFRKLKDLQAWMVQMDNAGIDDKKTQIIKALQKKYGITIRRFDMKNFDKEIALIVDLYNDAWEGNWGYVPLALEEFRYLAADLKSIIMANYVYIAELQGEPCAFAVAIPDLNQILHKIRNGRLLPLNFLRLLWHLKLKKSINQGRIALLGVLKKYQHIPIGAMLYYEYLLAVKDSVCLRAELSWILEDNTSMQAGLKLINASPYKTYRIYEKKILTMDE